MKKLNVLWIGIFLFSLVACSSDDDNVVDDSQLIGEWKLTEGHIEGSSSMEGLEFDISGELIEIDENNKLIFTEDQTFTGEGGFTMEVVISMMGTETDVQEYEVDEFFGSGTYVYSGATLELYNEDTDTAIVYNIEQLTESTLKLSASTSDIMIEGSTTVPFGIPVYMTFERI